MRTQHPPGHQVGANRCCLGQVALSEHRGDVCPGCVPPAAAPPRDWTEGAGEALQQSDLPEPELDNLPYLDSLGNLRIPLNAPARYRWWQGGQSPATTARELGASAAEIARLITPAEARQWK